MNSLPITLITASLLGLMLVWLSVRVIAGRVKGEAIIGDNGNSELLYRIRTHGNFTEYAPLFLILLGLLEISDGHQIALTVLAVLFVAGRLLHMQGMGEDATLSFRQAGMVATFVCLVAASLYGMWLGFA